MENKKNYETVIILKGSLTNEEYQEEIIKIKKYFERFEVESFKESGIKRLAYEVKENKTGYYEIVTFKAKSKDITELERFYRINEAIIKFITIRKDD